MHSAFLFHPNCPGVLQHLVWCLVYNKCWYMFIEGMEEKSWKKRLSIFPLKTSIKCSLKPAISVLLCALESPGRLVKCRVSSSIPGESPVFTGSQGDCDTGGLGTTLGSSLCFLNIVSLLFWLSLFSHSQKVFPGYVVWSTRKIRPVSFQIFLSFGKISNILKGKYGSECY